MEKLNFVFQTDSEVVSKFFCDSPNYLIEHMKQDESSEIYCTLYFSSNDLYFPNSVDAFSNQLLKKNKYEWYRTRINKASKHIFLRDIKKQWYLNGVNQELNSIEKLYNFLKSETKGYKLITVGSSAGGYAAVLFGSMLGAEMIYTFNGQFTLRSILETSSEAINPILFREKENASINQYFSINSFIKKPDHVYYFYSNKSNWDIEQYLHVKDLGLNIISFNTSHHGIPFLKSNLTYVLNLHQKYLKRLAGVSHNPLCFSLKVEGIYKTLLSLNRQVLKKYILKKFK